MHVALKCLGLKWQLFKRFKLHVDMHALCDARQIHQHAIRPGRKRSSLALIFIFRQLPLYLNLCGSCVKIEIGRPGGSRFALSGGVAHADRNSSRGMRPATNELTRSLDRNPLLHFSSSSSSSHAAACGSDSITYFVRSHATNHRQL